MKSIYILFLFFISTGINSQINIYYDTLSSDTSLMYTAQDVAYCFNKVTGDSYNVIRTNGTIPTDGIWLNINQNLGIVGNQTAICTSSDNFLVFSAPYPHGVRYGVYQYMEELGIRFYGPDTLWEKFPSLPTVFQNNESYLENLFFSIL